MLFAARPQRGTVVTFPRLYGLLFFLEFTVDFVFLFFSCLFSHFHVLTLLHVRHFTGSLVLPQEGFTPGLCPAVPAWARCAVDSSYLPRTSLHHPMFLGPYVFLFLGFRPVLAEAHPQLTL